MKRYIVEVHERAPKGKLLRYDSVAAENKSDFRAKVKAWNKYHPAEWIVERSAFVMPTG